MKRDRQILQFLDIFSNLIVSHFHSIAFRSSGKIYGCLGQRQFPFGGT